MKILRGIVLFLALTLLTIVIFLGILQLPWTKQKISELVFEIARKEGLEFTVGSIQGDPPFKWTLKNVHIKLNENDTLDIDTLRLRIAILPLLKREISIAYLNVDKVTYRFLPSSSSELPQLFSPPFSLTFKLIKIDCFTAQNLKLQEQNTFSFQAKARLKRGAKAFFFEGKMSGPEVCLNLFMEGSRRSDFITASIDIDVQSKTAFLPLTVLPMESSFTLKSSLKGPWETWKDLLSSNPKQTLPLEGQIQLSMKKLEIPELKGLDSSGFIDSSFALFSDKSLDITSLSVKSDLFCLKGQGKLDSHFYPQNFLVSFLLPHISHLVPHLGGIVAGEAKYDGLSAMVVLSSDQLDVGEATFTQVKVSFEALVKQGVWNGDLKLYASHPAIPLEGKSHFSIEPYQFIHMKEIEMKGPRSLVSGDVLLHFPKKRAEGALVVQIEDLSYFSPLFPGAYLKGKLAGKIDFKESQGNFYGIAQKLQCYMLLSDELSIDILATDLFSPLKGKLSFEGKTTYLSHFFFDLLKGSLWWEEGKWPFLLSGRGKWKDPLEFEAEGSLWVQERQTDFYLNHLKGVMLQKTFFLQNPVSMTLSDRGLSLSQCQVQFAEGYLQASLNLSPTLSKIDLKAHHFPLDLFALGTSRFTLQGNSSLDVSLEGSQDNLQGRINLLLEEGKVLQAGKKEEIQTRGSLQLNLDRGAAQIHGGILASKEQYFELSATIPIAYQLYPLKIGIEKNKPLAGEVTVEGHLEELFDFVNIGSHHITGFLSGRLLLTHTLSSPALLGTFEVQNGSYENYFTGMTFQDIALQAQAEGSLIRFTSIEGKDLEKGSVKGSGTLALKEKLPFSFDCTMHDLKILQLDWLTAAGSGPVVITGNTESALAKAEVTVSHADIHIPDELPIDLPILPVTYVNQPLYLNQTIFKPEISYPFHYDAEITAKGGIFLSGRGLNSELEGKLDVTGKNLSTDVSGTLRLLKGKFSFAGKDFTLTNGEITFSPTAYLNLIGTLTLPDLTVTAMLRGPLTSPLLTFQSSPAKPTSSILAQILFNKDISELSAAQAVQLADTIVTLSGGTGPGVLESIRKGLGIDRLNLISSADSDQVAVQIGKYLTRGVMVTLSQSTQSSQIIVEVELKGGFVLQAETQEDEQGKFSFKWNKNY